MTYKVSIQGKNYELPPRTLTIDEKIESISIADKEYQAGEISRREAVERIYAFVESLVPGSFPNLEEVDTNELMKACEDIITAYDTPARKAKAEAKLAEARDILNKPEVQKLLTLAEMKK